MGCLLEREVLISELLGCFVTLYTVAIATTVNERRECDKRHESGITGLDRLWRHLNAFRVVQRRRKESCEVHCLLRFDKKALN